jgi:hypothetical protein
MLAETIATLVVPANVGGVRLPVNAPVVIPVVVNIAVLAVPFIPTVIGPFT